MSRKRDKSSESTTRQGLRTHWKLAGVLLAILALHQIGPVAGTVVSIVLAIYALRGARQSFEALSLLAFLILLGEAGVSVTRWIVLFAAFGRTVWDGLFQDGSSPPVLKIVYLFGISVLVFSLLSSVFPLVSVLKLTTFVAGVVTVLTTLDRTSHLREYWLRWIFTLSVFILVASIPLYFLPAGYEQNGFGFQGIVSHPQTYGAILAPITALLTGLYVFHGQRTKLIMACIALGFVGMYMSRARTSLLAFMFGLVLAVGIAIVFKPAWRAQVARAFNRLEVVLATVVVLGLCVMQWSSIQARIIEFLLKDDRVVVVTEILEDSRGALIDQSMANFRSEPITGIGFGVPSNPERFERHLEVGFFGLPTSASIEKGFMPTAVLEETGIAGAILVLALIAGLFGPIIAQGNLTLVWMAASSILINFGEMVFFSFGGMGFYFWIILGFCYMYATSTPRVESDRREKVPA